MNTFNKTFCSWSRGCGTWLQELSCFFKLNCLNTMLSQQFRTLFFTHSFFTGLCQKPTLVTGMISLCFNKLAPSVTLSQQGTGSGNELSLTSLSCYLLEMSLRQGLWEFGVKRSFIAHKQVIFLSANTLGYK